MRFTMIGCAVLVGLIVSGHAGGDSRGHEPSPEGDEFKARAKRLAKNVIIVDGHIDLPYRLYRSRNKEGKLTEDVGQRSAKGDFDYPRAVAGGLDAPFMSIYVPARYQKKPGAAKRMADALIEIVRTVVKQAPEKFAHARSVADIRGNFARGKISLPMGIENGAALEEDLANVKYFYDRGVRYVTLAHSENNRICDSSYAESREWNGLSPFGRKVVAEMNRLGMIVDVSHVSDECFYQVLEVSRTPVVATHSSARAFTPGWERNMSDHMIERLAENKGVIMINFGSGFIEKEANRQYVARRNAIRAFRRDHKLERSDPRLRAFRKEYDEKHPFDFSTVGVVADHIDHVVKLVGVDHVGLGSDFDGLGNTLPDGLKDASMYPNLFAVLLKRGYSEEDIEKIASDNFFRVWQAVEDYARDGR